jgi:PAS domain S-box-containing protein
VVSGGVQLTGQLARLLEASTDGIYEVDEAGICTYFTAHGARLLGYAVEALVGKALHELIHTGSPSGELVPRTECKICQALDAGSAQHQLAGYLRRADGRALPVVYSVLPSIPDPEAAGSVVAFSDRTQLLDAELKIERLSSEIAEVGRRQEEFIAVLSHELRNPLAPLRTALQIMRKAAPGEAAPAQLRDMMERQLEQLVHLVDDLMDIARLTSGRIELKKNIVTLQKILSGAIEASAPQRTAAGNTLNVDMPEAPLLLNADETRLTQVFTNLLKNASQYSSPRDPITLRVVSRGEQAEVDIGDEGIGLGPEALDQIFEVFTAIGSHSERSRTGLGVGLNLSRRLIELHAGKLTATSEGLGKGSHFIVTLPLAEQPDSSHDKAPSAQAPRPPGRLVRVFIVDDNIDAAESLSLLLGLEGHTTAIAHSGLEAVSRVSDFKPDIVLLDIGLADMNGYDVARAIRALPGTEKTFLVAITGWGSAEDRRRSMSAGIDEHLTKPVDISMIELLFATLWSRGSPANSVASENPDARVSNVPQDRP